MKCTGRLIRDDNTITDGYGFPWTLLDMVIDFGWFDIASLLLKLGAVPDINHYFGENVLNRFQVHQYSHDFRESIERSSMCNRCRYPRECKNRTLSTQQIVFKHFECDMCDEFNCCSHCPKEFMLLAHQHVFRSKGTHNWLIGFVRVNIFMRRDITLKLNRLAHLYSKENYCELDPINHLITCILSNHCAIFNWINPFFPSSNSLDSWKSFHLIHKHCIWI